MTAPLLTLVLLAAITAGVFGGMPVPSYEENLRKFLFDNYIKEALPDKLTNVSIRITVRHFNLNEQIQAFEVDGWVVMKWFDPRLVWQTEKYDEIEKLAVHPNSVWIPDLSLYNNAMDNNEIKYFADTNVLLFADGKVMWVPPSHFKGACVMDLTYWPYDVHNCTIKLGSWVYSGIQVNLLLMDNKPKIDLTELYEGGKNLTRGSWHILETEMVRSEVFYKCCPEPYIDIKMTVKLQRVAPAFTWTVQVPVVVLSLMTIVVFIIPPGSNEKIIFGGIALLFEVFFIDYVATVTQYSPSHTPLIVKLACVQLVLTGISVIICAVVNRFVQAPHSTPLPGYFKHVVNILGSWIFISSYRKESADIMTGFSRSSVKADDIEQLDGAASSYPDGRRMIDTVSGEWIRLGAVIDRLFLFIYCAIFILNMFSFISVL